MWVWPITPAAPLPAWAWGVISVVVIGLGWYSYRRWP